MKISPTEQEWKTLQDEVSLYTDLAPTIGEKKSGKVEFEMDADDLDELNGNVAATANHAEAKRIETILDRIFQKIDALLEKNKN